MQEKTWWDISDEEPHEKIGRFVENAFGVKEVVYISRINWAYLDWCQRKCGCDVPAFIRRCDRERSHMTETFSEALEDWSYSAYEDNEECGNPRPDWLPPLHP